MPFLSSSVASCRDRTSEFIAAAERLKKNQNLVLDASYLTSNGFGDGGANFPASHPSGSIHSDFNKKASKIGIGLHDVSQKVSRLAKLAKKSSMFDDPAVEIQELTALIKEDLTVMNAGISELQSLCDDPNEALSCSKHSTEHFSTVVDNLKGRLMQETKEFKEVLTTRTESLKVHESRRQLFSSAPSRDRGNPFSQHRGLNSGNVATSNGALPPWANGQEPAYGLSRGTTHLRRRMGGDSSSSLRLQVQMQQEAVPIQDHLNSRSTALQNVESTITELSGMFTQLATMVAQQSELAIRIDENLDDTLANVEGAQGALLKYLHQISSNRWLIMKIFLVVIAFIVIFAIFIA
eukprot:c26831_g1_i1 orf=275-1327(-)